MKKYLITAVIMIVSVSMAFKPSGLKSYSDEQIKRIAFSELLTTKKVKVLVSRPVRNSVARNSSDYRIQVDELTRIISAMICLETGLLKSNGFQVNNLTGIKAIKNRPSFNLPTTEYVNGKKIFINQKFSVFFSFEDSIDNLFILWKNKRYKNLHSASNSVAFIKALGESGYATDPNYSKKILRIYAEIQ
jgi:flagellum-specific peptidoglycan hydrolase FlgJ